jgi:NAD+ synthase (glutamine-hydrolysing)
MIKGNFRIALAQLNFTVGDFAGNQRKILSTAQKAGEQGADLLIFPELALTGYPPEDLLYKEEFVPDNLRALRVLARQISGVTVAVGFVDRDRKGRIFNAAAILSGGTVKGVYHKHALPNYGVFDEVRYFKPGTKNSLFSVGGVPVGVTICEDLWREYGPYLAQARAGAQVLVNLSASPFEYDKFEQRQKLILRRAKELQLPMCYVNLVGGQDELVFDGGSLVVDEKGKILASGQQFAEELILVDLSLAEKRQKKHGQVPLIQVASAKTVKTNRLAVQLAKELTKTERVYRALVIGTRDYVRKNGFQKVVVGLSGGIDSSLVAVIARDAIGKENVVGVTMPTRFTSSGTRGDAEKLAGNLGVQFLDIPIQSVQEEYLKILAKTFSGTKEDVTEENLQARIRGNILMAFSNKFGWLVLTTGNKSEVAVGYCTLYGDMSGGFAVIKDVPKTLVYELAQRVNDREPGLIPQSVIERAPSAELRPNQTDQDTLPPYAVLDELLQRYVEEHRSPSRLTGAKKDLVERVVQMVDRSEYKRRQAPPGIKISPRAFGKDWRLPLTNQYHTT